MYVQGEETEVKSWVERVHALRYKDYRLAIAPTLMDNKIWMGSQGLLEEVDTVKALGQKFDEVGLRNWWRKGMGFSKED